MRLCEIASAGIDLKTVQKLLGHKNLKSAMKYLAKGREVRVRVEAIWGSKKVKFAAGRQDQQSGIGPVAARLASSRCRSPLPVP